MLEPPRGRPIGLLCWLLDGNMGWGRFVSTAQLSVQLRRLWLETYAPGQQSFVLSLRLPHRNAFRAPWDGDSGTLGCNGGTCGAPWTCLPSRRECELSPGDVSQPDSSRRSGDVRGGRMLHRKGPVTCCAGLAWLLVGGQGCVGKRGPLLDPLSVPIFGPHLYKVLSAGKREGPKNGPLLQASCSEFRSEGRSARSRCRWVHVLSWLLRL